MLGSHRIRICVKRKLISVIVCVRTYGARMFWMYNNRKGNMARITITAELSRSWRGFRMEMGHSFLPQVTGWAVLGGSRNISPKNIGVPGGITRISGWIYWALRSPTLGPLKNLSRALCPRGTDPSAGYWPCPPCRRQEGRERRLVNRGVEECKGGTSVVCV